MIKKDRRYYGIYLSAIILEVILLGLAIFLVCFGIINGSGLETSYRVAITISIVAILLLSLFGLSMGVRSMYGYQNIPNTLIEYNNNLTIYISKIDNVILQKEEIKSISIEIQKTSRSTFYLSVKTIDKEYRIKDVYNIKQANEELNKWLKGE